MMISNKVRDLLNQEIRTANIVWGALLGSIVMISGVAYTSTPSGSTGGSIEAAYFILLIAIGTLGASIAVPKIMLDEKSLRKEVLGFSGSEEECFKRLLPKVKSAFIVTLALRESVALFGFVASLVGSDFQFFIPGGMLAFISIFVAKPTEETFKPALDVARVAKSH